MPPVQTNQIEPEIIRRSSPIEVNDFIHRVYGWMSFGLLITAIISFIVASSPALIQIIVGNVFVFFGILIAELLAVIYLSGFVQKMSSTQASVVFLIYSALNGLTISIIFLAYEISSISSVFIITAGMFAIISMYGFITKKDLTTMGHIAFMGLIGIVLASIVNMFVRSDGTSLVISYIAVVVFVALTAYDTQKLKNINSNNMLGAEMEKKQSIIGALTLYLDFINLFLNLLRIMGRRK